MRHPALSEPRTKEEWREYLAAPPPPMPAMPTYNEYQDLSDGARRRFNRARADHHSAGELVRTPAVQTFHHELQRRLDVNRYQPAGARRGKVIDGPATVGKSTLVKWFAADFENQLREDEPERFVTDEDQEYVRDYVPVVYVSLGAQYTPKDLSTAIANYLMVPFRKTATKTELTNLVLKAMRIVGTELVILDDVHFLDLSMKEGRVVNDHLKDLANHTAATFVYTGVDLKASGLFLEGKARHRATQTAGRNDLCRLSPFTITNTDKIQEWRAVIAAMENNLLLFKHEPGTLVRDHWRYLHNRTSGSIASLSHLLRESAIEAVHDGTEAITHKLMEQITIDERGEESYRKQARKTTTTTRSSPSPRTRAAKPA